MLSGPVESSRLPPHLCEPLLHVRPLWPDAGTPSERTARRLCELAALAVAGAFEVPLGELHASTRRDRPVAFARQVAMYLAHVSFGLTYTAIGHAFGRDRTTAAHACRLVEERRDDPAAEALLTSLENTCSMLRLRLSKAVPS